MFYIVKDEFGLFENYMEICLSIESSLGLRRHCCWWSKVCISRAKNL